jgi:hypothetical protein
MRTPPIVAALALAAAVSWGPAPAQTDPHAPGPGFDRLKALAGEWVGTAGPPGGEKRAAVVSYRVTAAGSAVVETLFPGTPHEMVTVYHLDGGDLLLTHYCAAGNQPRMRALAAKGGDRLDFEFVSGTNMKPDDLHMHRASLVFDGNDHLRSIWTTYDKGQPTETVEFDLKRKP